MIQERLNMNNRFKVLLENYLSDAIKIPELAKDIIEPR
jgi:hypothetical protein